MRAKQGQQAQKACHGACNGCVLPASAFSRQTRKVKAGTCNLVCCTSVHQGTHSTPFGQRVYRSIFLPVKPLLARTDGEGGFAQYHRMFTH